MIRPIELEDKHDLFNYRSDALSNQYQRWIPSTLQEVEAYIQRTAEQVNTPDSWFQFGVVEKNKDQLIGDIGLYFPDKFEHTVELGCTLCKHHQNKGYAREALCCILDYLFDQLNKELVMARIVPQNSSSIKLFEALGFFSGMSKDLSLTSQKQWLEVVVYELTKKQYLERRSH